MRIAKFKGANIYIQLNALTPFFYRQQFGDDFYSAIQALIRGRKNSSGYKVVWALSKSNDFELLDYDQWILAFDEGGTDWDSIVKEISKAYRKTDESLDSSEPSDHYEVKLIVSAARIGLSLQTLRIMYPSDLINAVSEIKTKKANQADIDNLLL